MSVTRAEARLNIGMLSLTLAALTLLQQPDLEAEVDAATIRGIEFLLSQQFPDGSWAVQSNSSIASGCTALVTYALLKAGLPKEHAQIKLALENLRVHYPYYIYDAAMRCLLLTDLDPKKYKKRIERAMDTLNFEPMAYFSYAKQSQYSTGGGDLSNTQFATVGLFALQRAGFEIEDKIWEGLAWSVLDSQLENGGWGYTPEQQASYTMCLGGFTVLAACQNVLNQRKDRFKPRERRVAEKLLKRMEEGLRKADKLFASNPFWRLPTNGWFYYGAYSLERAMAIRNTNELGGVPWYEPTARLLVRNQQSDGSWKTEAGESAVNTAFALLTLVEATNITGVEGARRWAYLWQTASPDAELRITAQGASDCLLFLSGMHEDLQDYMWEDDLQLRIRYFTWKLNGETVFKRHISARDAAENAQAISTPRFEHRLKLSENGHYRVEAAMWVQLPGKSAEDLVELSAPELQIHVSGLDNKVDDAEMKRWRRHAFFDLRQLPKIEASSFAVKNFEPERAFDRHQSTAWIYGKEDREPWIRLEMNRSLTVKEIRLLPLLTKQVDPRLYDQIKKVDIIVNEKTRYGMEFGPEDFLSGATLTLKRAVRLKKLEVQVKERQPGTQFPHHGGFREIEILKP